jgi:hypothetical protein
MIQFAEDCLPDLRALPLNGSTNTSDIVTWPCGDETQTWCPDVKVTLHTSCVYHVYSYSYTTLYYVALQHIYIYIYILS